MIDATGLAQHILTLEPAKSAARLCFYHYLKNLCEANEPVTREMLNAFYARALVFPYWQEHKGALFAETQASLNSYRAAHPARAEEIMPELNKSWRAENIQIVRIESQTNLIALAHKTLERELSPHDEFRVLPEAGDRAVGIVLTKDKRLVVMVFLPIAKIMGGELSPLCRDYTLHYGPDLLLAIGQLQQIDVGGHTTARFRFTADGCRGLLIRGYTFQKYAAMEGGSLHRHPVLFYPLKRLEQFFINRKTDPMYIELTGILEKAGELLNQGHPEAIRFAGQALERGKLALEQIFPDDKLVRLLINNLEKTLALEAARRGQSAPDLANVPPLNQRGDWATTPGTMSPSMGWVPGGSYPGTMASPDANEFDRLKSELECERNKLLNP